MRYGWLALVACGRVGFDGGIVGSQTDAMANDGRVPDGNQIAVDAAPGTLFPAPNADTYLQGVDNTLNGADVDVRCGRNPNNGNNLWALFRFDLAGVPQQPVAEATLRLYQYANAGTVTLTFEVYRVTQAWDEPTAEWSMASSTSAWPGGGSIAAGVYTTAEIPLGAYGYYDWNVTALVNEWLTGTPNHGLELQYAAPQPSPGNYAAFASREHPTAAWHPKLLIRP